MTDLDYKTCQLLKDAGFPQNGKGYFHPDFPEREYQDVYVPTLEELIEACEPTALFFLTPAHTSGEVKEWACIDRKLDRQIGTTPKQAVVALYLALNKK